MSGFDKCDFCARYIGYKCTIKEDEHEGRYSCIEYKDRGRDQYKSYIKVCDDFIPDKKRIINVAQVERMPVSDVISLINL